MLDAVAVQTMKTCANTHARTQPPCSIIIMILCRYRDMRAVLIEEFSKPEYQHFFVLRASEKYTADGSRWV
jgi:hypothetical protein